MGLGKGIDPLYTVIHSSFTLYHVVYYVDAERYVLKLHRWVGFALRMRQFQDCTKVLCNFKIGFMFRNLLPISNLQIYAISKLRKFANCMEHICHLDCTLDCHLPRVYVMMNSVSVHRSKCMFFLLLNY